MALAHCACGAALIESGDFEHGRHRLLLAGGPELVDVSPGGRPRWYGYLADAELGLGRLPAAEVWALRAESLAATLGLQGAAGHARRARAAILLEQGRPETALASAAAATASLDAAGAPIDAARASVIAARALMRLGWHHAAGARLEAAHTVLESCGARRAADEAARELRLLGRRVSAAPGGEADGRGGQHDHETEHAEPDLGADGAAHEHSDAEHEHCGRDDGAHARDPLE